MPTRKAQKINQHLRSASNIAKLNVGSKIEFYDLDGNFVMGKVTCFYPIKGYVDVRSVKGHTYRWRCT